MQDSDMSVSLKDAGAQQSEVVDRGRYFWRQTRTNVARSRQPNVIQCYDLLTSCDRMLRTLTRAPDG